MILALDIGGTNIRSAIVKNNFIKSYKKTKTPKKKKETLEKIEEIIKSYSNAKRICISTAGFERDGKIQHSLNNDLNGVELRKILKRKFKVPVYIENDANCAALAELNYGSGKKLKNFILLTLGSGIGGAIILNKKLYKGNGAAGEIGSMILQDRKIFEHLASGNASIQIAEKLGLKVDSLALEKLADKKNKSALKVYKKIGENLGVGLANLSYIFDPDAIILGGGFSRVKHIHKPAEDTYKELYKISPRPKILKAKFGDNAGLIGAGLLAKI